MMTMKNILTFKNSVVVLGDIGDKFNKDIVHYFTEGRNKNIQMIVVCHKPAQINNMARMNCDTIYITTYNGADLFQNFNTTYKCKHDIHGIIQELNNSYYNCTNKIIDYIKPLMNSATDRNTINKDNYIFYSDKLLTSRGIKIQNDVLTKEKLLANVVKYGGRITMGIGILLYIHDCLKPDPTVKTAARVATHASHLINRTGSLLNTGYRTPSMLGNQDRRSFHNGEDLDHEQKYHESSNMGLNPCYAISPLGFSSVLGGYT